jgi:undecaprenyl-diphosphatase
MFWASDKLVWIPFYVFLIYILVMHYRKYGWILAAMAVLLVVISDQTSVQLFKEVVERLRPCHDPALEGIIRVPGGRCGGKYSFVSSHATNHFAIALFTGYFLQKKVRGFLPAMLLWAAVISYSRVYLGVHYPGDVLAGAAWGSLLALGMIIWGRNTLKSSNQPAATERHK